MHRRRLEAGGCALSQRSVEDAAQGEEPGERGGAPEINVSSSRSRPREDASIPDAPISRPVHNTGRTISHRVLGRLHRQYSRIQVLTPPVLF
jgi:hypothetical protein